MELQTKKIDGATWLSTLSMYKCIELSAHQKLKERIKRMGLEMREVEGFGTAIESESAVLVLRAYQSTLKNGKLLKVNELLNRLTEDKDNHEPEVNRNPSKIRLSVKPSDAELNQASTTVRSPKKSVKSSFTESSALNHSSVQSSEPKPARETPQKKSTEPIKKGFKQRLLLLPQYLRSEFFVFVVLICAITIQVHHTAELYRRISEPVHPLLDYLSAYTFGSVAELTALLLTIHRGKPEMLRNFAFFSFWVNLLYFKVWEKAAFNTEYLTRLISEISIAGFLAYVIFIYAHLFTLDLGKKQNAQSP